jgi:hypothetical protein
MPHETTYKILAMGWSLSASIHKITEKEFRFINSWANREGYDYGFIPGSLEGVIPDYSVSAPNLRFFGISPLLEQNRFLMLDPNLKVSVVSAPLIHNSPCRLSVSEHLSFVRKKGGTSQRLLVHLQEYRGISGKWSLDSQKTPSISKLSINYFKLKLGRKEFCLVDSLSYKDSLLFKKESQQDLSHVTSYSFVS